MKGDEFYTYVCFEHFSEIYLSKNKILNKYYSSFILDFIVFVFKFTSK